MNKIFAVLLTWGSRYIYNMYIVGVPVVTIFISGTILLGYLRIDMKFGP